MLLYILVMINLYGCIEGTLTRCPPDNNPPLSYESECSSKRNLSLCWDISCPPKIMSTDDVQLQAVDYQVEVSFPVEDIACDKTDYNIELRVNEELSPAECATASHDLFDKVHSRRLLEANCSSDPSCTFECLECITRNGKLQAVTIFRNIFDGCYLLKIKPENSLSIQNGILQTCPQYLWSGKPKKDFVLVDQEPLVLPMYNEKSHELTVYVNYTPLFNNNVQLLIMSLTNVNNDASIHCEIEASCKMPPTKQFCCNEHDDKRCGVVCHTRNEEIHCTFLNISAGNYSLRFSVHDERCSNVYNTVWNQSEQMPSPFRCKWDVKIEAQAGPSSYDVREVAVSSYTLAGILVLVAVVLVIAGAWSVCRLSPRRFRRSGETTEPIIAPPPGDILLLYARDCQPFMELMNSLRRLLQNATSAKVYDCFDPRHWDEMSRDPLGWIRSLIQRKDMKVVLVASRCASWRHQSLCTRQILRYREPSSLDSLFLAAVKDLQETPPPDVYSRVFVIRFHDFTDDNDLFANLNCYARFVMPSHLSALLTQLTRSSFTDLNFSDPTESDDWKELQENLEALIKYTKQNQHYLQEMLTIQNLNNYSNVNIA